MPTLLLNLRMAGYNIQAVVSLVGVVAPVVLLLFVVARKVERSSEIGFRLVELDMQPKIKK